MRYFASFNLSTNYGKEAWARAVQGFGIAFLFVPTSRLAYSFLPKGKNNKASSLTNLFRNWGGSFGTAFVTTLIERRTQYHGSIFVAHTTSYGAVLNARLAGITEQFVLRGYSTPNTATRAMAQVNAIIQRQAAMLGSIDCFWLLGLIAFSGPLLALLIRRFHQGGGGSAH
jgi:DHA2 family multidrug resistance protein